jgi:predicted AlkP superfamily pyrophosphatase or phosphodiesterase
MTKSYKRICIINAVGLSYGLAKKNNFFQEFGQVQSVEGVFPALTCSVQASYLTGKLPNEHGIVANGWLYPDTREVRFWQQSHHLIQHDTFLKNREVANMFWWFAQGANTKYYATPKPFYANNADKAFGILDHTGCDLVENLGKFPFHEFWGPFAGGGSSEWIANATARVLTEKKPQITLCYLPHLDYDFQRFGPVDSGQVNHLIKCIKTVSDAAKKIDAKVIIISEYGIVPVEKPIHLNKILREKNWLKVRPGPFGETLETFESKAFAVVDHQMAHIYTKDINLEEVKNTLINIDGIEKVEKPEHFGLENNRSGDLIAISDKNAWFTWPYWLDEKNKPDFANSVDIHRKPGYDPCDLFLSSKLNLISRIALKKMGFKVRMSMIDPDPNRIKGSHGLINTGDDSPVIISEDPPQKIVDFRAYIDSHFS